MVGLHPAGFVSIRYRHGCTYKKTRGNGRDLNWFRGIASAVSDMGWLWTGWIGPTPVQISGMLSVRRAVFIVCGLLQGLVVFSLTFRFFVNSHLDHSRA